MLGLLLAAITISICNQSCSGEPMIQAPGTAIPEEPPGPAYPVWRADLTVTGNRSQIFLSWVHYCTESYDYVLIYRSEFRPPIIGNTIGCTVPAVVIPMGADPFCYTFIFSELDNILPDTTENYYPVYYTVAGANLEIVGSGPDMTKELQYRIKWITPDIKNMEWLGKVP